MSTRYWIRFYSPGSDPRPVSVPAPCQWWCSGYGENDSVVCAIVRSVSGDPWRALEAWWPGLRVSSIEPVADDWVPSDRFPHKPPNPNGYIEQELP